MYGRNDLANYSLSGNKSPSMKDSTAKPALPEEVVTAIESIILFFIFMNRIKDTKHFY